MSSSASSQKPEIVDADHAREPEREVAGVGVHLADGVADDAVGVVVEVRARGRETRDDAALDQRDQAALVQSGRRHRAREREEHRALLVDRALHQLEGGALLPADVSREGVLEQLARALLSGDRPRVDAAGLLERLAQVRLALALLGHGARTIARVRSRFIGYAPDFAPARGGLSRCARWWWRSLPSRESRSQSRPTATSSSPARRSPGRCGPRKEARRASPPRAICRRAAPGRA